MLWFWTMMAAVAAEPRVEIGDGHVVVGSVTVDGPVAAVRERLGDPVWTASVSETGTEVVLVERAGDCRVYDNVSPNAFKTVRYRTKQCPTEAGWRTELVESDSFTRYQSSWEVVPKGEGSEIRYRLALETSLMVPQWVIDRTSRKEVTSMLRHLSGAF